MEYLEPNCIPLKCINMSKWKYLMLNDCCRRGKKNATKSSGIDVSEFGIGKKSNIAKCKYELMAGQGLWNRGLNQSRQSTPFNEKLSATMKILSAVILLWR